MGASLTVRSYFWQDHPLFFRAKKTKILQWRICLVSTFCSDYARSIYQWNAGHDDAVSINRSINL